MSGEVSGTRRTVGFGILGVRLDAVRRERWSKWRPTVSLFQHDELKFDRFHLVFQPRYQDIADTVLADIAQIAPDCDVVTHEIDFRDAWDFEHVYERLHEATREGQWFDPEHEDLLVHITTGTHVMQICLFLLTESRHLAGRLIQTSPDRERGPAGRYSIIDLDLSRYDAIAARFEQERVEGMELLKQGIDTRNPAFNTLISRIARVAAVSTAPMLLTGPTGAGKTRLAGRLYELKKARALLRGPFVEVNCATLRGDQAMSTLFGHRRGAFTGAHTDRAGVLKAAHGGLLFLDEVAELGLDEQAMLLRAIEDGVFTPLGSDRDVHSDFQLLAGTNADLRARVRAGRFRDDLLARLNLWHFELPGLKDRPEDVEPNLDYELEAYARRTGRRVRMNTEARRLFLSFATSPAAIWRGNFRDLNGAVIRMSTLAAGGRITADDVRIEIERLSRDWGQEASPGQERLLDVLGPHRAAALDRFDAVQLADVLTVCATAKSLSDAGRQLFAESRKQRTTINDADRIRKYLKRFDLTWADVRQS